MDISPSNYALAIEAPVVSFDRESGLVILPLLHYDLPPDCQVRDLDIRNRLVSYGISLLEFEPGFYVRANPRGLETCETFHHKKMTLKVLKTLSPSGSDSCGRRTLWLTGPLILPNPHFAVYIDVEMLRQPGRGILARRRDCFATILRFKTKRKELSSFDLICRFRNPRGSLLSPGYWECDLAIDASDATKGTREQAMFYYQSDHDFGLTSRDDVPSPVSKSLNIAFRPQGSPRDMAVVVTLQRKRDLRNGSTHFSLDVNLKGANK